MDAKEAAKWIRATYPVFRAHPEQWGKHSYRVSSVGGRSRFCAIGGATALYAGAYRAADLCGMWLNGRLRHVRDAVDSVGLLVAIMDANDDAIDVETAIARVEAVLAEAGL